MFLTLLALAICAWFVADRLLRMLRVGEWHRKHILITGCDSGFGRELAVRLDTLGFPVFAGCLTEGGAKALGDITSSRLRTLQLDVTDQESIAAANEFVQKHISDSKGLWALVNNAGITGQPSPLELCTHDDFLSVCTVNLFGPINMTRVFLPLLRMSRGRVVSVGSVMGRYAATSAPYSVSKFGMEAFSDVLRREVAGMGVKVSLLEPGFHRTPLLNVDLVCQKMETAFNRVNPEVQTAYGGSQFLKQSQAVFKAIESRSSPHTSHVVDAYVAALTSRFPRARYVVGWDARLLFVPLSFLPVFLADSLQRWGQGRLVRSWMQNYKT